ncbi:MAG: hypothetical protein R3185_04875, partial [Candidatus Thermoplasmatota archaeon]|nr:hypothetical protein [Candidatus Thermoplasmatota archaeon]
MDPPLAPGTRIALLLDDGSVHLLPVPEADESLKVRGLGVLSGKLLQDARIGGLLEMGRTRARVLDPTPELIFEALSRKAQVITPPDAARIAHGTGVGPGSTVVEGGLGSGGLTTYLAHLVGEQGKVHGFDLREDHARVAAK